MVLNHAEKDDFQRAESTVHHCAGQLRKLLSQSSGYLLLERSRGTNVYVDFGGMEVLSS